MLLRHDIFLRILGNFGNHFKLAIWRFGSQSPN